MEDADKKKAMLEWKASLERESAELQAGTASLEEEVVMLRLKVNAYDLVAARISDEAKANRAKLSQELVRKEEELEKTRRISRVKIHDNYELAAAAETIARHI